MCRHNAETRLFEASPFFSGAVAATISGLAECRSDPSNAKQSIDIAARGSVSSGLSKDQEFLIQAIGGLIGGLAMGPLGAAAGAMITGDFLRQANSVGFNTELTFPFEQGASGSETAPTQTDIALCAETATFSNDAELGRLTAVVHRSGRKSRLVARRFHSVLKQQEQFAKSEARGEVTVDVPKGQGWWHIANQYYGDGRYFLSLMGANPQIPARPLYPGERVTVPTMRALITDPRTVRAGDSLWTIAVRVFGDGSRWRELFDPRYTNNPNLVFPASPTKKQQ